MLQNRSANNPFMRLDTNHMEGVYSTIGPILNNSPNVSNLPHTRSFVCTRCFVCNELLSNKLASELVFPLECDQLIHEQCFVEMIRGLPLSIGNLSLIPNCFCHVDYPHKFIPKDRTYFNQLILKLSSPPNPQIPLSNKNSTSLNVSPNLINLASTLVKKSTASSPFSTKGLNTQSDFGSINNNYEIQSGSYQSHSNRGATPFEFESSRGSNKSNSVSLNNHELSVSPKSVSTRSRIPSLDSNGSFDSYMSQDISPSTTVLHSLEKPQHLLSEDIENNFRTGSGFGKLKKKICDRIYKLSSVPSRGIEKSNERTRDSAKLPLFTKINGSDDTPYLKEEPCCHKTCAYDEITSISKNLNQKYRNSQAIKCFSDSLILETPVFPTSRADKSKMLEQDHVLSFNNYSITNQTDERSIFSSNVSISTTDSFTPKIHANKFLPLDTLKNQFIKYLLSSHVLEFTELIRFGNLRLVDNLFVSKNGIDWTSSIVYLFENCLIVLQNQELIQIAMQDILPTLSSSKIIKLTSKLQETIYLRTSSLLIEKWVIAMSDTNYNFPAEVFTSTIEFDNNHNTSENPQTFSIYFEDSKLRMVCSEINTCDSIIKRSSIDNGLNSFENDSETEIEILSTQSLETCSESEYDSDEELLKSIYKKLQVK